jgi:hypothetical protein
MCQSHFGPNTLQPRPVRAIPSTKDFCLLSEIVDMPVGAASGLQMMFDTCFQTTGTECTAEVQIER